MMNCKLLPFIDNLRSKNTLFLFPDDQRLMIVILRTFIHVVAVYQKTLASGAFIYQE